MKRLTVLLASLVLGVAACPSLTSAAIYTGNGNTGFGDVIGNGSLELTSVGTDINATLTIGAGDLNDALVLYLDTTAGGFATTSTFDDNSDGLRQAISGLNFDGTNRAVVDFAAGFGADFAIALDNGFAGLWGLSETGSHNFVTALGLSPTGDPSAPTFNFTVGLSSLGLTPGDSFDFVGTYLNGGAGFRSDEAFGPGIVAGNPGQGTIAFTGSNTFVTAIPEPSSYLALTAIAVAGWAVRRRRQSAKA